MDTGERTLGKVARRAVRDCTRGDGRDPNSAQMEYTGANSYWPNAMFFARAVPDHPTKIVTIVTGHHEGRVGELFLFDSADEGWRPKSPDLVPKDDRFNAEGLQRRIPYHHRMRNPILKSTP